MDDPAPPTDDELLRAWAWCSDRELLKMLSSKKEGDVQMRAIRRRVAVLRGILRPGGVSAL